jgi:hypothetical protein
MGNGPLVSVVIPAYNLGRYLQRSIDSVLSQASPGGAVEVIVVDDGSTDETPDIVAAYGERVRSVRQENGGLVKAVDAGLGLVLGTYVALHDADDEMPPGRLQRQVAALEALPLAGLVHSDMEVIDENGDVIAPSFFSHTDTRPFDGRVLGKLMAKNFVAGGASLFRSSLLPAMHPISPYAAFPDWWIATCAAAVSEIHLCPGLGNRYRQHGQNMGLGIDTDGQRRMWKSRELPWRLWTLRNLIDDRSVDAADMGRAYTELNNGMLSCASVEPGGARALTEANRPAAARILDTLPGAGVGLPRSRSLLKAIGHDPFDGAAVIDFAVALQTEAALGASSPAPALIGLQHRERTFLAPLGQVLADQAALLRFAASAADDPTQTLVILAPPGADTGELEDIFSHNPALQADSCDVTVITEPVTPPARAWLASLADGWFGDGTVPERYRAESNFGENL